MDNNKPKRALLAYCALADRLEKGSGNIFHALIPFFSDICKSQSGRAFDAGHMASAMNDRYGFTIPRLAILGMTGQLEAEGLLVRAPSTGNLEIFAYADIQDSGVGSDPPVSEEQVEKILSEFSQYCRDDDALAALSDQELHEAFLDRLLHVESMKILSRREASIAAKKTAKTITLTTAVHQAETSDNSHLRIDFIASQFLLDLRNSENPSFDIVSKIAFASMAAEAVATFREPPSSEPLSSLTVYIDSPLLLDMLGVNTEYSDYGKELLDVITQSGATPAVLDHSVAEAENAIAALLANIRSGINQFSRKWGVSARPDLLAALSGNVAERAQNRLRIAVHRDPEVNLHRRAQAVVGDIESEINRRMQAWRNEDAKEHDRKSVWAMLAMRDTGTPSPRVCDASCLLVARNTALVDIANSSWRTWLRGSQSIALTPLTTGPPQHSLTSNWLAIFGLVPAAGTLIFLALGCWHTALQPLGHGLI